MSSTTQVIARHEVAVTSPCFGPNGELFAVSATGDIFKYTGNLIDGSEISVEPWGSSSGQPMGLAIDPQGAAFVCDAAHQCLFRIRKADSGDGAPRQEIQPYVKEYEGRSLVGPNSVAISPQAGTVFFTDSGPMGETSLSTPTGSLYAVNPGTQLLLPLLQGVLAHPGGVCISPDEQTVYVGELFKNRILRLVQRPPGVWLASVFCQLQGRMGPSAIACTPTGELLVAHFDVQELQGAGRILCIDAEGQTTAMFQVPGAEITGLCVSPCGRALFVTEASSRSVYRVSLTD
uniref:SMP-30/Gluconolactonase/LRE-like region domain-containing protein n=1 Tax=Chromera velia CCMP2878 TaxID=1169474 RepID=A0A0G4FRY7_9ALVE|eukprot:Cvel_3673.t1-p1 / transcript=Cvel_3673.t1 / gene=Cvel_3673 / organism=Chromera_velia_CCMP2878 / gene_product=hypothetical protein / transcript_product=hypothetical protein / location=Cvel_scaffold152:106603-110771(+) / protein_length=289 / sequence_SO=supercontig / SO=protein_coding / is_pseudo=false